MLDQVADQTRSCQGAEQVLLASLDGILYVAQHGRQHPARPAGRRGDDFAGSGILFGYRQSISRQAAFILELPTAELDLAVERPGAARQPAFPPRPREN